jgi:hypothetical protein
MSLIEDVRQVVQDFLAPELCAIAAKMEASEKIADARHKELLATIETQNLKISTVTTAVQRAEKASEEQDRLILAKLEAMEKTHGLDLRQTKLELVKGFREEGAGKG